MHPMTIEEYEELLSGLDIEGRPLAVWSYSPPGGWATDRGALIRSLAEPHTYWYVYGFLDGDDFDRTVRTFDTEPLLADIQVAVDPEDWYILPSWEA